MHKKLWRRAIWTAAICGTAAALQAFAQSPNALSIEVLSSRPDLVSGGDALVRITGTGQAPSVSVGGRDVSASFKASADGAWLGLVEGLSDGDNQLVARDGSRQAALTLKNHPLNGTLFAGPQQSPFLCENENHNLAPATDQSCAAPSKVAYFYRNRGGEWKAVRPQGDAADRHRHDQDDRRQGRAADRPPGEGRHQPLRLSDQHPARSGGRTRCRHQPRSQPASGWNGKLIYSFGPGVQASYHMGRGLGMMTGTDGKFYIEDLSVGYRDAFIARGYAIAAGSLNVFGTNSDDVRVGRDRVPRSRSISSRSSARRCSPSATAPPAARCSSR